MSPVAVATRGKGVLNAGRRAGAITSRYGVGPRRMERRLDALLGILERYSCEATLPVTGAAVERNPEVIGRYAGSRIEFAVHGYYHVDHVALSAALQREHIVHTRRLLEDNGAAVAGFRAPYLRFTEATLEAVDDAGLLYDSSQAMHWPLPPGLETDAYRRVLGFYSSRSAADDIVLPRMAGNIVRMPYCLPDDEAVVERLRLPTPEAIADLWVSMFEQTNTRGELFTLGLHPERIDECAVGLSAVLEAARKARPPVWVARLNEVARWWQQRAAASLTLEQPEPGRFLVHVTGPAGLTLLAPDLGSAAAGPRADGAVLTGSETFELSAPRRPVIAVHPRSPAALATFLREHGYPVERAESGGAHAHFLNPSTFTRADERPLLDALAREPLPLLRLGRWPGGARSALCVSGDIDALTIRDYALRFVGR